MKKGNMFFIIMATLITYTYVAAVHVPDFNTATNIYYNSMDNEWVAHFKDGSRLRCMDFGDTVQCLTSKFEIIPQKDGAKKFELIPHEDGAKYILERMRELWEQRGQK
jgi:hypothetical protein